MTEQRLERIEKKLDQLGETLATLARVEERQYAQTKRMDRFEFRLDEYERETDVHIRNVTHHAVTLKLAERILWAVFAAGLSIASVYMTR